MRRKVTAERLQQFMQEFAGAVRSPGQVYFTGGATALLLGFRAQTIDIDLKMDPEPKGAFQAIAELKRRLDLNVELAAPDDFIPRDDGWRDRCRLITAIGFVRYFHYDFSLQALAKLERGHVQDLEDVTNLLRGGHVTPQELLDRFAQLEPGFLRYPAIDPAQFQKKVRDFLARYSE